MPKPRAFRLPTDEVDAEFDAYLKTMDGTDTDKIIQLILSVIRPQDEHDFTKTKHCPFYCLSVKDPSMVVCAVDWTKRHRIVRIEKDFCLNTCQLLQKEQIELEKATPIEKPSVYNLQPIIMSKENKGRATTEQTVDVSKSFFCKLRGRMFYSYKELPCMRKEVLCPEIECIKRVSDKFL